VALLRELFELARLELPRQLRQAEERKALQGVPGEACGWDLPLGEWARCLLASAPTCSGSVMSRPTSASVTSEGRAQMYAEGKLPEPERIDGVGPLWKPATIERWAEREWWETRRWRRR
jgi:hypothetical protein